MGTQILSMFLHLMDLFLFLSKNKYIVFPFSPEVLLSFAIRNNPCEPLLVLLFVFMNMIYFVSSCDFFIRMKNQTQ